MSTAASVLTFPQAAPNEAEIRRVFEKQRDTAIRLRTSTAEERIGKIKRLWDAIDANRDSLVQAGYDDFKRPPAEVLLSEMLSLRLDMLETTRNIRKWMKPQGVWPTRMMMGTKSWIQHEPRGRCLIIAPWNYAVNLAFGPMIYAIAAGNTVILKPSEMTPHLSAWMVKIVREVFKEDEVAIFEGDASVSTALLALPFDHIFFTGSPAIGKVVMAAAAKNLTSVTLELGGKSPTVVDETADIKLAAQTLMWGKYVNNGQTCIAPDHIFVHESVKDAFVAQCIEVLKNAYGATPQEQMNSASLARVVNQRHTQRINGLLQDAKQRGAKVLCGDVVSEKDCFIAPTLLENIPADAKIMSEEIFGPVLPIIGYRDLDKVIDQINADQKPLALYIWSKNDANTQKILKRTTAGGTCINHVLVQFTHGNLPFGGVNNSGIGNAHGVWGFKAFSHERAVVKTSLWMAAKMFFPPYNDMHVKLMNFFKKIL